MQKIMKIPFYIPFIGIIVSAVLFIIVANMPDSTLLIASVVLFHLSGWIIAVKFFLCGVGGIASALDVK
jgi:hypothetical protein